MNGDRDRAGARTVQRLDRIGLDDRLARLQILNSGIAHRIGVGAIGIDGDSTQLGTANGRGRAKRQRVRVKTRLARVGVSNGDCSINA